MTLREARWRDVLLLRRWRNDAGTRSAMRNTEPIGLWEHLRWFWKMKRREDVVQYVAWYGDEAVGTGRLDFMWLGSRASSFGAPMRIAEVDVVVAPDARNAGLGCEMIKRLADAGRMYGARRVYAVIRDDNRASLKAFAAAGFVGVPSGPVECDHGYQVMEYR